MLLKKKVTQHYRYEKATGALKYTLTNDYLFRMVLQRDKETLIMLICSVLQLKRDQVIDAIIDNPIEPGKAVDDKEYQLDIVVKLNGNITINLEMQVVNYHNWSARSLCYLCRKFDSVARGDDYNDARPVYQIGFLDFTLFEDHPEFFAKYQMRSASNGYLYTDKFNLFVVELRHTDMATEEDKRHGVDAWAKLFKATTWEEIKMITQSNPSLNSAAEALYLSTANKDILEQCRIREDNIAHEKYQAEKIQSLTEENENLTSENANLTSENERLRKLLEENGISVEQLHD
jgi:predicted transposase/invertase (TIGR01784 family)